MNKLRNLLKRFPNLYSFVRFFYIFFQQIPAPYKWFKLSKSEEIKLELGSGVKSGKNGFTTVDFFGADINYDLRNGIPLKDKTVDVIYTSHMLEHIPYNQLIKFIGECKRVLKSKGIFSVCVPNAELYLDAYNQNRNFKTVADMYQKGIIDTGSCMDQVNYEVYMDGEHCYMFDKENLINTIKKGGFNNVELREFDASLDLKSRDYESIYAIAYND
tara:strand:- start:17976 stop:18623 length:648 start_codon:yes stop_codon:yes gene_type:complete